MHCPTQIYLFKTARNIGPKVTSIGSLQCCCSPQGRTVWWNPVQKAEDEFEEEEEEEDEDREQPEEPEPETGPQLLTSIAEDASKSLHPLGY